MTSHRNLKAAVRRFAAERSVPYTEARRLMGLDVLHFNFTDEASQIEVEVSVEHNDVEVRWYYPDGSSDYRLSRTDLFLGGNIWTDAKRPAHQVDGSMEGYKNTFLDARIVDRIRQWLTTKVSDPTVLSVRDEEFITMISKPWDRLGTYVDLRTHEATSHLIRLPDEPSASKHSLAVFTWQETRSKAVRMVLDAIPEFAERFNPHTDISENRHVIITDAAAQIDFEGAIAQHRELMSRDWYRHRYGINPELITSWRVIEHRELVDGTDKVDQEGGGTDG